MYGKQLGVTDNQGHPPPGTYLSFCATTFLGASKYVPNSALLTDNVVGQFPTGVTQRRLIISKVAFETRRPQIISYLLSAGEREGAFVVLMNPFVVFSEATCFAPGIGKRTTALLVQRTMLFSDENSADAHGSSLGFIHGPQQRYVDCFRLASASMQFGTSLLMRDASCWQKYFNR